MVSSFDPWRYVQSELMIEYVPAAPLRRMLQELHETMRENYSDHTWVLKKEIMEQLERIQDFIGESPDTPGRSNITLGPGGTTLLHQAPKRSEG